MLGGLRRAMNSLASVRSSLVSGSRKPACLRETMFYREVMGNSLNFGTQSHGVFEVNRASLETPQVYMGIAGVGKTGVAILCYF